MRDTNYQPSQGNIRDSPNSRLSNVRHVQFIEFVGLLAFMLCSFSLVAETVAEIDERQRPKSYQIGGVRTGGTYLEISSKIVVTFQGSAKLDE